MSRIWYVSDLHLLHQNLATLRGYSSIEEHDAIICDNWVKSIREHDTVIHCGDETVGGKQRVLDALAMIKKLPGKKIEIPGNHSPVHPMHRDWMKWVQPYNDVFDAMAPFMRRKINGINILHSHFPYCMDHTEVPRYQQYRLPDMGEWLIHGHGHSEVKKVGKQINVCLEAWGHAPVSQEQIVEELMTEE